MALDVVFNTNAGSPVELHRIIRFPVQLRGKQRMTWSSRVWNDQIFIID